jgi:hypothetical protein
MLALWIILAILISTVRHEGSHALAAWSQGVPLYEVRLFPGMHPELGFYFGYVSRGDGGTWLIDAAPFFAAVAWFILAFLVLRRVRRKSPAWLPLFVVGAISPLVDLIYNYQGGLWRQGTDVSDLFQALPDPLVHGFFVAATTICLIGLSVLRSSSVGDKVAAKV